MFIAIPVGMNYRTERLPVVTFSLIGVNILIGLVSLICWLSTAGESQLWIYDHLWLRPAVCTWYAPLTSMFVHEGFLHLFFNMVFLFLFGSCVEDIIGRARFIVFYLVGGLIAEIAYIAILPEHFQSMTPMGGASGAISTCMGMYLVLRAGADIEIKYFLWLFVFVRAGGFEIPAWVAIAFWFGENLLSMLLGFLFPHPGGGVAFGAHVGGFAGGLALAGLYRWQARLPTEKASPNSGPIINPAELIAATARKPAFAPASTETPTIFLHDGLKQTGPFTLTQVQAMLQRAEIGHDTSYWSEGMVDWQNVLDLASHPME